MYSVLYSIGTWLSLYLYYYTLYPTLQMLTDNTMMTSKERHEPEMHSASLVLYDMDHKMSVIRSYDFYKNVSQKNGLTNDTSCQIF